MYSIKNNAGNYFLASKGRHAHRRFCSLRKGVSHLVELLAREEISPPEYLVLYNQLVSCPLPLILPEDRDEPSENPITLDELYDAIEEIDAAGELRIIRNTTYVEPKLVMLDNGKREADLIYKEWIIPGVASKKQARLEIEKLKKEGKMTFRQYLDMEKQIDDSPLPETVPTDHEFNPSNN